MNMQIDLRRSDFEAMHPAAKLFGFDDEAKMYFGELVDGVNKQWSTWCACIAMVHLEVDDAKSGAKEEVSSLQKHNQALQAKMHDLNALVAKAKSSAVPDGYCVVPKNPTNSMAHAGKEIDGRLSAFKCADIYKAMIEAAQDQS